MHNLELRTDATMRDIAAFIREQTGPDYGFAVVVFPFAVDETVMPQVGHYISNAKRVDMIKALREQADVLEQNLDIEGATT